MASEEEQPDTISRTRFDQLLQEYPAYIKSVSDARNTPPNQKTLVELDKFRYEEAVAAFGSRPPQRAMGHDDVKALVEWKLRHGKFRPTLMKLVSSNDNAFVDETISKAMTAYWERVDAPATVDAFAKLKGIGPATASLLLSVHDPERVLFFSDEAFYWLCCRGRKLPIKYNTKEYGELSSAAQDMVQRLRVSATDIEKVAYVLINKGPSPPVHGQPAAPTDQAPARGTKRAERTSEDDAQATQQVRRSKRKRRAA